jgi:hypothetical protein
MSIISLIAQLRHWITQITSSAICRPHDINGSPLSNSSSSAALVAPGSALPPMVAPAIGRATAATGGMLGHMPLVPSAPMAASGSAPSHMLAPAIGGAAAATGSMICRAPFQREQSGGGDMLAPGNNDDDFAGFDGISDEEIGD